MKRTKVKGFTLIELIVVMAIFSIIMFGAMSLMTPTSKIMTNAENMENGVAAASNISKYLETELSAAEYLHVYNELKDPESLANDFAKLFYSGVLKAGSTAGSPDYGKGKVHVLQMTNDGQISRWDYNFDYTPGSSVVQDGSPIDYAVNKSYYDAFQFEVKPGSYSSVEEFDAAAADPNLVLMQLSAKETSFTFKATTKKKCSNGHEFGQTPTTTTCPNCGVDLRTSGYSFVYTSSMALVNIYNRNNGSGSAVSGQYFIVDTRDVTIPDPADPTNTITVQENYIADRASTTINNTTDYPNLLGGFQVDTSGSGDGFTFVYSYGQEQDTQ